jgi:hypothetical protein
MASDDEKSKNLKSKRDRISSAQTAPVNVGRCVYHD